MNKEIEELTIATSILSVVQNLDDAEEAYDYARLYIKAINVSREQEFRDPVSSSMIYSIIGQVDSRFKTRA